MKYRICLSLAFGLFLAQDALSQINTGTWTLGIEGSYGGYRNSSQYTNRNLPQYHLQESSYGFGFNVGYAPGSNWMLMAGYRRMGSYEKFAFSNNTQDEQHFNGINQFLLRGRFLTQGKGKIGVFHDFQYDYTRMHKEDVGQLQETEYFGFFRHQLAYTPRVVYFPIPQLSLDLAFFQLAYYNQSGYHNYELNTSLNEDSIDEEFACRFIPPQLGIHYYLTRKSD